MTAPINLNSATQVSVLPERFHAVLQGLSAYQIALRNGFAGSEAEWLESLANGGALPANLIQLTAGAALSGHRAIRLATSTSVLYASANEPEDAATVFGISVAAAASGAPIVIRTGGIETFSGWAFTPGDPVFVGVNGLLTQTPPTTGAEIQIGVAIAATTLLVRIGTPFYL